VIEMTTLVDPAEFQGRTLVYLPKYVPPDDPAFALTDAELQDQFVAALERMYPHFKRSDVLSFQVSRVKYVVAISTLNYSQRLPPMQTSIPGVRVINSAHILNGTLNVNETVQLAETAIANLDYPCPVCRHLSQRLFQKHNFWIRECTICRHRFAEIDKHQAHISQHVTQIYSDAYFQGGGAGYPDYLAESSILRQHGQRYGKLLSRYRPPGRVLDVGAAAGFILQGLVDSGWQGQGLEPNPQMAKYAQQQLKLKMEVGALEQLKVEDLEESDRYDLVTFIQVIAHFFDLQQALAVASEYTKKDGFWLIETWNYHSFMAQVFAENWHEYSPPSVLHWFAPQTLTQLAAQYGFHEVARGQPSKWINAAHAKSLLRYKLAGSAMGNLAVKGLNVVPDRLALPYPAEDLLWMLFKRG
jgi:2-polyprenyl-3-methyl-5-hydroxy-6-metoxy-1,4-benzoquinol methylase